MFRTHLFHRPASGVPLRAGSLPGVLLLTLSVALLLAWASPSAAAVVDRVAAVVGNEAITVSELEEQWDHVRQDPRLVARLHDRAAVLSRLIDQRLQLVRARELGLAPRAEEVEVEINRVMSENHLQSLTELTAALNAEGLTLEEFRRHKRDEIALVRVAQREVVSHIRLGETAVRRYYTEHIDLFSPAPVMHLRQIQASFAGLPEAEQASARQRMQELAAKISGTDAFLTAERELAGTPGMSVGEIGTVSLADLRPELARAVHLLQTGQVSAVVDIPGTGGGGGGVALFLAQEVRREAPRPFSEVGDTVRELATREEADRRVGEWLASLRREAHIVILSLGEDAQALAPVPAPESASAPVPAPAP
ncbi:MAG: SurA N-terminal domain-containing protein [Nitrospirota bacterium]|nr:SurA N-terminal domain-containing protein [Nitrospirota bacterium]